MNYENIFERMAINQLTRIVLNFLNFIKNF